MSVKSSASWRKLSTSHNNSRSSYNIAHDSDCNFEATSPDYSAHVYATRDSKESAVLVSFIVQDNATFTNNVQTSEPGPTAELGTDKESFWVNFRNEAGDYLRVGVNPSGAYKVKRVCSVDGTKDNIRLESEVNCEALEGPNYRCRFKLPFSLLPRMTEEFR